MQLTRLLEIQRDSSLQSQSGLLALDRNLGDAYLLQNNRVFRNIRRAASEMGFRFSNERNVAYESLPLAQLEVILKAKQIPYVDNVSALEAIPRDAMPSLAWDDVSDHLKKNYLMHESCHAAVRPLMLELRRSLQTSKDFSGQQMLVLTILMEESFANACEMIGISDAVDAVHRIFYESNSYFTQFERRANIAQAMKECGEAEFFQFMLLAYLQSNFLRDGFSDTAFETCLTLVGKSFDPKAKKTLRALAKVAFELDPRFRRVTTGFHLRMQGIGSELGRFLDFDFVLALKADSTIKAFLKKTAALALKA